MSIVAASQETTILGAALAYARLGLSVIGIRGKLASVKWKVHEERRATLEQIQYWHKRAVLSSVGIVCGAVSGNLVVMDLDSLQTVAKFEFEFPDLLNTYTVTSNRGKHIYWYVDRLPQTTKTDGYELRAHGCYVVAPPSVHPSGKPYRVENPVEIMRVPDLDQVVKFIEEIVKERQRDFQRSNVETAQRSINKKNTAARTYTPMTAAEELQLEAERVALAPEHHGNNTLYRAALKLGSLVTDRELSINEIENVLMQAAKASGLAARDGERKCMRTIKSGLDNGMKNSRRDWRAKRA